MHIDDLHLQQQKQLHHHRDQLLVLLKCFVYTHFVEVINPQGLQVYIGMYIYIFDNIIEAD